MAFNIAPPWNPGFALPDNVKDEGLERHAYVTEMLPRGTADRNARVSTGGYVVPQYVLDEGLDRGTYTTAMSPRGTRANVPHYLNQRPQKSGGILGRISFFAGKPAATGPTGMTPLGGTDYSALAHPATPEPALPEPFASFGRRAASEILGRVGQLPVNQREGELKKILHRLDPSAWARTVAMTKRYRAQGVHPTQAIPRALSRALGTGLAAEMLHKGHKAMSRGGKGYQSASGMLGAGRAMAMGDTPAPAPTLAQRLTNLFGGAGLSMPANLLCQQNPPPGYTWDDTCPTGKTTTITSGPRAGQTSPVYGCFRPKGPNEPAVSMRSPPACITPDMVKTDYHGQPVFTVDNLFQIPLSATTYAYSFMDPTTIRNTMPGPWLAAVQAAFNPNASGKDHANPQTVKPAPSSAQPDVYTWLNALGVGQPFDFNPLATPQGFSGSWFDWIPQVGFVDAIYQGVSGSIDNLTGPPEPIAQFTHPKTGDNWGVWIRIAAPKNTKVPAPVRLTFYFGKMPDNPWYGNLLHDIFTPVAVVGQGTAQVVGDALAAVGSLVCAVASNPITAGLGGAAAGAAVGGPAGAKAGVAGASVATAACTGGPPSYVQPDTGWLVPVLVAGGVAALALLLTKKKKAP